MSVSYIPERVKVRLWGKAAGRCQYKGCNKPLWVDSLTKVEFNISYIAHIVADSPDGPRGDKVRSELLKNDISNLMLMCDEHHRLIDKEDVVGHTEDRLLEMKRTHEQRIEMVTSISEDLRSHILLYGANIGEHSAPVSWDKAAFAMFPENYPAEKPGIELSLVNSPFQDHEEFYWLMERESLRRQFADKVKPRLNEGLVKMFSVFALAPQPLLIELGVLLSDIPSVEVYQLHREPPDWKWQGHNEDFKYILKEPQEYKQTVALNLSLSATIDNSRIQGVLGDNISIWTLTIERPNNDFLKSKQQLRRFREELRLTLDKIKSLHGHENVLHIFPAAPVAIAIEIGRIWMPKADLPLHVYDENRKIGGFIKAFEVTYSK
ncbi:hypothetical protein PSTEL_23775 [Paenibacillus stellifer]|uniref:SMODS-associated and fused to various effectors domain-containing protein n=1 Tax=Paenibacillus stellifer TaxID=169760 RepID=A0A089M2E1_9BACL|nr:SAVED domain-containing protein [Paenibacillus stellifer]AIQ65678.1 hypothetical protein PSTEL_23775 [Paenibacillus stellifer]